MGRQPDHGVRQLEMERSRHRHGEPLTATTDAAVGNRMLEIAADHRGGLEQYSGTERPLLKDLALCDYITDTVVAELARRGSILAADGAPLPVLKCLATFMNTKRLNAIALGLQRPSKDVPDLDAYLQEHAKTADAAQPAAALEAPTDDGAAE